MLTRKLQLRFQYIQPTMKRFLVIILALSLLIVSLQGRRKKQVLQEQHQTKEEQQTVIQANHFSSKTETKTSYDINQVIKDKSLLFVLKPHNSESTDKVLQDNPITITLKDGDSEKQCLFNSYTQLCVLAKVSQQKMLLSIQCKKLPCELSWLIIQPATIDSDGDHALDNLVSVNKDKNHAVLKVSCDNPDLTTNLDEGLVLYTNSHYKKVVSSDGIGLVQFLFNNQEQGYYYLTSSDEKIQECANATLLHMNDQIEFNNQKDIFMDFIEPGQLNSYEFKSIPTKDFSIQAEASDLAFNQLSNDTAIKIILVGYNGETKSVLSSMALGVDNQKTYIQFSAVYKAPSEKYDKMAIQLDVIGRTLMVRAVFVQANVQQVQLGELSFFDLKKGEKINYKLLPLSQQIKNVSKIHIFLQGKKFKVSQESCPPTGCQFTVEALDNGQGNIYLGEGETRDTSQLIIEQFQKSISSKIYEGQIKYYSFNAKAKNALQLLINVPSVIVYAASKSICPHMDQNCYQTSFNHHFPSIYQPNQDGPILFKIIALDNCQFTLTVIDGKTPFFELKDTQPFAYLFDDKEKVLIFQFKMEDKEDVSFNLIGPVNELNLYVLNEERPAQDNKQGWENARLSSDGFIKFSKQEITGLNFAIKVQKRQQFYNKYAHFTLIVSSKQANLRLQTGSPHYQTLKPKDARDYVFEFIPDHKILLNFYTHNIHKDVKINLKVSNADEYSDAENMAQFTIDKNVDILDIGLVSARLCKVNQGQDCQLFIRIQNMMDVQADLTITLLVQNSIIQLKDGIWQSYSVNAASTSAHFYFLPKHLNHSATIFYKPSVVDLRILYNVWKSDDLSINPLQWPFPVDIEGSGQRFDFKPLQYIHVEPQKLKECWPNCVILLSMITNSKDFQQMVQKNNSVIDASFKIMGTNNYIQLPQKHKIDILLSKNESKQLLVDLKYFLDKEKITFYTHFTIGNAKIIANVYSQSNPRCPTSNDPADFDIQNVQSTLQIQEVKKKMGQNSMDNDKNIYLCLLAQAADHDTKFNIQFNSNGQGFQKLPMDSTHTFKGSNKQALYYFDNSQQIYLKITRNQGFPYYKTTLCKSQSDMSKCFKDFQEDKEKGSQIANKVTTIAESPCQKCILLLKIESVEQTQMVLHTQSKFTELQLSANKVVADSLSANQQNRYTLTGTKDEQIIINIQITSGDLKVGVHDFQKIDITKQNSAGSKNIHITVPPKDLSPELKELGTTHMSSFGLSNFVHLHITVESQDHSKSASYSITYSSGQPVVYLQDGLINEYNLIPKKITKFIYKNPLDQPIYLYTSTTDTDTLNKLKIKYYALDNLEDEETNTQLTPEKPSFNKKTANPTNLVKLIGKNAYYFTVINQNDKNIIFTIGVNNRQIIYLPFDHEFPIELGISQYIYFVLNVAVEGYVKVTFSKCSINYPFIGYTQNYDQFIKEDYSIEDQMNQDLVSELVIKVKASSGLYIKVRSSGTESTLMSVKAIFSNQKIKMNRAKPGDKGLIQYQLLDSTKAQLTFTNLVCSSQQKNCNKNFVFTALSSDKLENIYSQLVCSSIMFSLPEIQHLKSPETSTITNIGGANNKISFTQAISKDIEYVGVKAVNSKTGQVVYYQPVQIVTFWGELHRSSQTTIILGVFLILIFGCGCLMVYRRYKKNQYRPLGELNDIIQRE